MNYLDFLLLFCPVWGTNTYPLAPLCIHTYLKDHGYATDVIDLNIELYHEVGNPTLWDMGSVFYWLSDENMERIFDEYSACIGGVITRIKQFRPKILAFSINSANRLFSTYLAREIKKEIPDQFIICGGCGIRNTSEIQFIRERADVFDIYVIGEGERKALGIMQSVKNRDETILEHLPDIYIKRRHDLMPTETRAGGRVSIEALPLLDIPQEMLDRHYDQQEVMPVFFSRGCIGKCVFCNDAPRWKFYRTKSGKKMFREVSYYHRRYQKSHFNFHDLLLNANLKQLESFCDQIINSRMDIRWSGFFLIRKDMTLELCRKLKKAGCSHLNFGVDNFSDNVLKLMGKLYNTLDIVNNLHMLNKSNLYFTINYIVGFPGETGQDFEKELDFLNQYHELIPCVDSMGTLDVNEYSYIFSNLDEFDVVLPSGVFYGHNLWTTKDKKNTPEIRKSRLRRMVERCREHKININYINNEY